MLPANLSVFLAAHYHMQQFSKYDEEAPLPPNERTFVLQFLSRHLHPYGDPEHHIDSAMQYALRERSSPGGFVLVSRLDDQITGVVVMNRTGMGGYIPENILVYIATHERMRGQGIGRSLMHKAIELASGDIALHVEPDNPALRLYERLGFSNKYLEMRLHKTSM
jgi:ribosomal-protein-alanine N-acetyltransferase